MRPVLISKHPGKERKQRVEALVISLITVAITAWILWKPLILRVQGILDPFSFNGDALQHIAPMWFVHQPSSAVHDYTLRYYLEAILPPLFKAIYAILTNWLTPAVASKLLTIGLSLAFIIISTLTARRLAGWAAGSLTFFLATAGVLKNLYFMGGIQRGFGFCISSLALYLVCSGRLVPLGLLGVVAAMLYPAAAVCIITILGLLVLLPRSCRGSMANWSIFKRLSFVAVCAGLMGLAVAPQIAGGQRYGQRLSIDAAVEFPEWGPEGRYTPGDRGVPVSFRRKVLSAATSALSADKVTKDRGANRAGAASSDPGAKETSPLPMVVIMATLICAALIAVRRPKSISAAAWRCGIFCLGITVAFFVACQVFPLLYIPARYLALGATALTPVVFPVLWRVIVEACMPASRYLPRGVFTVALGSSLLLALGWHTLSPKRLPSTVGNRALFGAIRALPADAVIAAWPRGIANMIPLFTARSVLVFEEGHQIFHRDFLEEMRRRTRAIIAAFAATDVAPLQALRRDYRVSHILVNKRHLTQSPDYFAPFDTEMRAARERSGESPLILSALAASNSTFVDNDYVLIDIQGLTDVAPLSQHGPATYGSIHLAPS
ncbi:MAG: hypothetical protein ACK5GN_14390 [Pseudomonadota bacterium]